MSSGLIDTSVVIHAIGNDDQTRECQEFLRSLEKSAVWARLELVVLHELSYTLKRYRKQMKREDIGDFLLWLISLPGVECDKNLYAETVSRWASNAGLGFVDAYLISISFTENAGIFTKNVREFRAEGAKVIDPLLPR